jgi:cell division protein FtsW (lipid II flippase)
MAIFYPIGIGVIYFAFFLLINRFFKTPLKYGFYSLILVILLFAVLMVVRGLQDNTGWMNLGYLASILVVSYVTATYAALWAIFIKISNR